MKPRISLKKYKFVLFDRDGTLNYENKDYHLRLEEVRAYPFSQPVLQWLASHRVGFAVVTNQSGIGRDFWSLAEVEQLHERLSREWAVELPFYICPHLPDDGCGCRKPGTDLLRQALETGKVEAQACLMVGDSAADWGAAKGLGLDFALVLTGHGRDTLKAPTVKPDYILNSITELRDIIDV
jgi:D-glycero-D-manno-heptose 1,7-bisphosphate phosphatase